MSPVSYTHLDVYKRQYIHKPFNMQYVRLKIIRIIEERKRLASTFAQKFGRRTRHEAANLPCVDAVSYTHLLAAECR